MDNNIIIQPNEKQLRQYAIAAYALYAVSLIFGISLLVGVILAYVKRHEANSTIYASHFQYLIRTFWVMVLGVVVGAILSLIVIGYLILLAVSIWFIYRVVVGAIRLNDNREADTQTWF